MLRYRKPHKVKMFQLTSVREVNSETGEASEKQVKTYIGFPPNYSEDTDLYAYVRQLSANERIAAKAVQEDNEIEVVINAKPVATDMYMEFEGKTYQIGAEDLFDFENLAEIKFRARSVNPPTYDSVTYRSWR